MIKYWRTGLMLVCVAIMLIAHSASYTPKNALQRGDATRQHVQKYAVSLEPSISNAAQHADPQRLPDADAIASSDAQAVENCRSLGSNDTNPVSLDSASQPTSCPSSDYVSHSDGLDFAPINSLRFISLAQHDVREVQPVYRLAVDFTVDPTPNVVESTAVDITSDWTLSAVSSPARISGWKVSNLQYRFSQQAA